MSSLFYIAACLLVAIGVVHSYLGEKYILVRLFRRDNLPKLFGGVDYTKRTLRFAWHITTVAWFGMAVIIAYLPRLPEGKSVIGGVMAMTLFLHFLVSLIGSKGKHLSWPVFLTMSVLIFVGINT